MGIRWRGEGGPYVGVESGRGGGGDRREEMIRRWRGEGGLDVGVEKGKR